MNASGDMQLKVPTTYLIDISSLSDLSLENGSILPIIIEYS